MYGLVLITCHSFFSSKLVTKVNCVLPPLTVASYPNVEPVSRAGLLEDRDLNKHIMDPASSCLHHAFQPCLPQLSLEPQKITLLHSLFYHKLTEECGLSCLCVQICNATCLGRLKITYS